MNNKPLVSIIIPTYNRAAILQTALASAVGQTYPNKQIIVIDDGSSDNTVDIVSLYPQVEYIYKTNGGQASARNRGLEAAKGQYIASLDSDDCWDLTFVETCVEQLEKDSLDFVFTNWFQQESKGDNTRWRNAFGDYVFLKPYLAKPANDNWVPLNPNELRDLYLYNCPSPSSSVIVRRTSIVNGWNTQMNIGDDWCMLLDIVLAKDARAAFCTTQQWYKYRDGTNIYDGRNEIDVLHLLYVTDIKNLVSRNKTMLTPVELNTLDKKYIKSLMTLAKHYLIQNHDIKSFAGFFKTGFKESPYITFKALVKLFFEGLSTHLLKTPQNCLIFLTMEIAAANINTAIECGVSYLYQHIYPNGEFCCYMANTDDMQDWCVPDTTNFPTTLIANSLLGLRGNSEVDEMLASVIKFLMSQISLGALWEHYTQAHRYYPLLCPDVDNTVFASSVLRELGNEYIHPINTPIILANRNSKGLLYTWFVFRFRKNGNRTYWRVALAKLKKPIHQYIFWKKMECGKYDVDGVVNANALYYMGDTEEMQPVIKYLIEIIEQEKEAVCDKWYQNPLVVYYFITRNYCKGIKKLEPVRGLIISRILSKVNADGRIGESALETAVTICSLLNLQADLSVVEKSVNWLLLAQNKNGNWDRRLLFYSGPKRTVGWGSEELTTAFCLEALQQYNQTINLN